MCSARLLGPCSVCSAEVESAGAKGPIAPTRAWILQKVDVIAATAGANWLDTAIAGGPSCGSDDTFDSSATGRWSKTRVRNAAAGVAQEYALVVDALKAGDTTLASQRFGVLTQAFATMCDPLQTDNCRAEWVKVRGRTLHARYEQRVARALTRYRSNRVNRAAEGLRASGVTVSIARYAARAAVSAHHDTDGSYRDIAGTGSAPRCSASPGGPCGEAWPAWRRWRSRRGRTVVSQALARTLPIPTRLPAQRTRRPPTPVSRPRRAQHPRSPQRPTPRRHRHRQ